MASTILPPTHAQATTRRKGSQGQVHPSWGLLSLASTLAACTSAPRPSLTSRPQRIPLSCSPLHRWRLSKGVTVCQGDHARRGRNDGLGGGPLHQVMSFLGQGSSFTHPCLPALGIVPGTCGHFVNVCWINRQAVRVWRRKVRRGGYLETLPTACSEDQRKE